MKLATEVLSAEKKKVTFWKLATITIIAIAVVEFIIIVL